VAQGKAGKWKVIYKNPTDPEDLVDEKEIDVMAAATISPEGMPRSGTTPVTTSSQKSFFDEYSAPFIGILLIIIVAVGLFYARRKGKRLVEVRDEGQRVEEV